MPETITEADFEDDRFLMPVLPDDALIMCLDDLPSTDPAAEGKGKAAAAEEGTPQPAGADSSSDLASKNATLEAQLDALTKQFASYRLAVEQTLDKRWHAEDDSDSESSSTSSVAAAGRPKKAKKETKKKEDNSNYYWEGYANHGGFTSPVFRSIYFGLEANNDAKYRYP